MITKDTLKRKGLFHIRVLNKDGSVKFEYKKFVENIMTNVGIAQSALLLGDGSATAFTYLALGSSATTPAAADTALGAEYSTGGLSRAVATFSRITTTVTNDTAKWYHEFTASATNTIREIGIFNASSSGVLLCHGLTGDVIVQNGDPVQVTYTVVNT